MGIDVGIYNNLLRPPKSVAEYDQEAMANQQNRLALQSSQMQMADRQRGVQQENALAEAYRGATGADGKVDRNKLFSDTAQRGLGAKLPGMQKAYAESDEAERKAEKEQFTLGKQRLELIHNAIAGSKDQGSYSANRQMLAQNGIDISQIPEQYDPAFVANAGQQSLTHLQRVEQVMKEKGYMLDVDKFGETVRNNKEQTATSRANTAANNATSRANNRDSLAQSEQASLRSDSRARDFNATRSEEVKAKTAIGKAPTEFQGKSAAFGARADQADKIITSLEGKYRPGAIATKQALGKAWVIGGALEAGGNMLIGENEQKAEQAQRDFINAVLRQESGAAIGESEFENAKRQYFPATGDTQATRTQKAENRRLAVKGFKSNAGRAQFDTDAAAPGEADDIHAQAAAILGGK